MHYVSINLVCSDFGTDLPIAQYCPSKHTSSLKFGKISEL